MRRKLTSFILSGALALNATAQSAAACSAEAMLVFDASGSMAAMGYNGLNVPRITEARVAVARAIPRIAQMRKLGLVVYGPGPNDSCSNIDLRLLPQANAAPAIVSAINRVLPDGDTPLTQSVKLAADLLMARGQEGDVVLVTDGRETCLGQPCALAADLAATGRITVHVIGFRVRPPNFQWQGAEGYPQTAVHAVAECLADRTGGLYLPAETAEELERALLQTLSCANLSQIGHALQTLPRG